MFDTEVKKSKRCVIREIVAFLAGRVIKNHASIPSPSGRKTILVWGINRHTTLIVHREGRRFTRWRVCARPFHQIVSPWRERRRLAA